MFTELAMIRVFEQLTGCTFGVVSNKLPDPEGNLIALKDLGGQYHSQKNFKGASFCFILGALCMESGSIDDKKSTVVDAVAKCHSNVAMTQLHGGGSMNLAVQSCKASSSLLPLRHKPWYLLGLCLERKGEKKNAANAFRKALLLAPTCTATRLALGRVSV
jgi:tetratricopeptide (TPR) repeat protein